MPTEFSTATLPLLQPLQSLIRLIPPGAKGKQRLVRFLLPRRFRSRAAIVHDREGYYFYVPSLLEPVGLHLWMDGVYEPDTMAFMRGALNPGDVFVDVGANIGVFAIPLAQRVGTTGRVMAIEASPAIGKILIRNIRENRLTNILTIHCAASTGGQDHVDFYEAPRDHFGMGSSAPQFDARPIPVAAMSLDQILQAHSLSSVAAIKVDVEGYEAHVFTGASRLLAQEPRPRIIFEFCDWAEQRAFPGRCGWAQSVLLDCGYRLWTLADYLRGKPPLKEPVSKGTDTVVGIPIERLPR